MKELNARYRTYCNKCQHSIWQGERIRYNGKPWHLDCQSALRDNTPRVLNPRYVSIIGKTSTKKVRALLGKPSNDAAVGGAPNSPRDKESHNEF